MAFSDSYKHYLRLIVFILNIQGRILIGVESNIPHNKIGHPILLMIVYKVLRNVPFPFFAQYLKLSCIYLRDVLHCCLKIRLPLGATMISQGQRSTGNA